MQNDLSRYSDYLLILIGLYMHVTWILGLAEEMTASCVKGINLSVCNLHLHTQNMHFHLFFKKLTLH